MPNLAASGAPRRQRRLSLRITDYERHLIEQAALLTSAGDVTRFVMRVSVDAARDTIEQHEVTRVSNQTRLALYDLLLNPPAPSAALRRLAANATPDGVELVEE